MSKCKGCGHGTLWCTCPYEEEPVKRFSTWKIKGYGRKKIRYYERESQFNKWWKAAKASTHYTDIHAYQFTSNGWEEIE